ncbi:Stress-activated map kinase-interacting protein 1-like protein [Aphelenchoides besseyi]|nr:Stress-activated map kinase-interacting protein 1-like protein [Aphelenchoides besseyi]
MAYFGNDEIVDCLRHGVALDDLSGFAAHVLGKPIRRSKPGGLPLILANQHDSSDEDPPSPNFKLTQIPADSKSTSEVCRELVLKKSKDLQNLINARRLDKPNLDVESAKAYFKQREIPESSKPTTSLLSRLLSEKPEDKIHFNEFAKFEAIENEPDSRTINVIFPFSSSPSNQQPKILAVRAKDTATVDEFIGLCCYLYNKNEFKPQCISPSAYSLYLADDTFDFDAELPALDRFRLIGECGFNILALVQTSDVDQSAEAEKYVVNVHQTNGTRFVFELDTLNKTLEWLRDESAKRSAELMARNRKMSCIRKIAYHLEALDGPDETLKLSSTIAAMGTLDFLLIRQNSSRGDFVPSRNDGVDSTLRTPLFVQTKQRPSNLRQAPLTSTESTASISSTMASKMESPTTPVSRSGFPTLGSGEIILEFQVERLHRIKPRSIAKLVIRDDCLEVFPIFVRKFVGQSTQKATTFSWDLVADIEHHDRHNGRRLIKIVWLSMSPDTFALQEQYCKQQQKMERRSQKANFDDFYQDEPQTLTRRYSSSQSGGTSTSDSSSSKTRGLTDDSLSDNNVADAATDEVNWQKLMQAYNGLDWRVLSLETNNEDAWKIGRKINEIIESKHSFVRQIYQNSSNGSRRVRDAVELTFNKEQSFHTLTGEKKRMSMIPNSPSVPNLKLHKKRLSINPFPALNRMLSKPD